MSVTNRSTLDQALALARRLSIRDRARLIAQIAEEMANAAPATTQGFSQDLESV